MKKTVFLFRNYSLTLFFVMLSVFCIIKSGIVQEYLYDAVLRCLTVVIPSLYAMMIMSDILVKSGIIEKISQYFGLFIPVFIFSMFAGYPVGTKIMTEQYRNGIITKRQAEIYSGLCFGGGPAFINGCVVSRLYGKSSLGMLIFISLIVADILCAVVILPFSGKIQKIKKSRKIGINYKIINDSIFNSGKAMTRICLCITAFGVVNAFLDYLGAADFCGSMISVITHRDISSCRGVFSAFLDITNVKALPCGDMTLLPVICAILSFGGLCVIFQLMAVTEENISVIPIIIIRTVCGLFSYIICRMLLPFFIVMESVEAASMAVHFYKAPNPVPSVMLILMTLYTLKLSGNPVYSSVGYSRKS